MSAAKEHGVTAPLHEPHAFVGVLARSGALFEVGCLFRRHPEPFEMMVRFLALRCFGVRGLAEAELGTISDQRIDALADVLVVLLNPWCDWRAEEVADG